MHPRHVSDGEERPGSRNLAEQQTEDRKRQRQEIFKLQEFAAVTNPGTEEQGTPNYSDKRKVHPRERQQHAIPQLCRAAAPVLSLHGLGLTMDGLSVATLGGTYDRRGLRVRRGSPRKSTGRSSGAEAAKGTTPV